MCTDTHSQRRSPAYFSDFNIPEYIVLFLGYNVVFVGAILAIYGVLAIELTLYWNSVRDVYTIKSTPRASCCPL
jgi:hypothetical protein